MGFYKDDTFEEISSQDGDDGFHRIPGKETWELIQASCPEKYGSRARIRRCRFYYVMMSQKDDNVYDVVVTCEARAPSRPRSQIGFRKPAIQLVRAEVPLGSTPARIIQYAYGLHATA